MDRKIIKEAFFGPLDPKSRYLQTLAYLLLTSEKSTGEVIQEPSGTHPNLWFSYKEMEVQARLLEAFTEQPSIYRSFNATLIPSMDFFFFFFALGA